MGYIHRLLVAIDQLGNTVADGDPDETISSRVGRNAVAGRRWALILEKLIDAIPCFGKGHCRRAIGT